MTIFMSKSQCSPIQITVNERSGISEMSIIHNENHPFIEYKSHADYDEWFVRAISEKVIQESLYRTSERCMGMNEIAKYRFYALFWFVWTFLYIRIFLRDIIETLT